MAIDQHASNLINITVKTFNGDVTSISPLDGISLIDSWINFLKTDDQAPDSIVNSLSDLKAELQRGNLDGAQIQHILKDLTGQTSQITKSANADSKPELTTLSDALQGFSQLLYGSKKANTGGQAPMTSTVGGESSHSGTEASTVDTNDDDFSNRNGGTTSSAPTVDMDDTTGSNGGSTEERLSGDNYAGNSQGGNGDNSSLSRSSRSDTSRVEGIGVSGGTGDSDSSQSGGRSQY
ncbi:hypothetical protein [Spirosoma flavum]|uniref:Uncharacterized protein n=1 Tax=Spirosoma flavum TaxID=2048557 RepID=A0ABW6AP56_9BACT